MDNKSLEYFFNAKLKKIYKYRDSYRNFHVNFEEGYITGSKIGRFEDLSKLITSPTNKSTFEALIHEYLSHYIKSVFTVNLDVLLKSNIRINIVFYTYFEELPTDVVSLIAAKLDQIQDINSFCKIGSICNASGFWINLVKKDYPFRYKRDYPWEDLYRDILEMKYDSQPWDLPTLAGFYIYEGLAQPKDYHKYIESVINGSDLPAIKVVMEAYAKNPEILSSIQIDLLLDTSLNKGNLDVIKELLKYNDNDVMKHKGIFEKYLRDDNEGYNDVVDFIFTYPDVNSHDKARFILAISHNYNYETFNRVEEYLDPIKKVTINMEIVGIDGIIKKYDVKLKTIYQIISLWTYRPFEHECDMLSYILDNYRSYFTQVKSFEYLYGMVSSTILENPSMYKWNTKTLRCIYGLLHNFPTYKKLEERDND